MSSSWLIQEIKAKNRTWEPRFSLKSSYNWIQALDFEISSTHGLATQSIYDSAKKSMISAGVGPTSYPLNKALVFEPLLHSLTYCMSLASTRTRASNYWVVPSTIVCWYYSIYFVFRSIVYCSSILNTQSVSATAKVFNEIRPLVPHPFNMVATLEPSSAYHASFPSFPETVPYNLSSRFTNSRTIARGMMLQYLKGTADRHVRQTKRRMKLRDKTISDFRGSVAKKKLQLELGELREINFLNCVFRYRGRVNYRDGVYLTVGEGDDGFSFDVFLEGLRKTANFAFLFGLAFCSLKLGTTPVISFVNDLKKNIRGLARTNKEEKFWSELSV